MKVKDQVVMLECANRAIRIAKETRTPRDIAKAISAIMKVKCVSYTVAENLLWQKLRLTAPKDAATTLREAMYNTPVRDYNPRHTPIEGTPNSVTVQVINLDNVEF